MLVGKKADTEQIRRDNRRELLETLRNHGAMARVELGHITGLSPATVTAITSELMQQGYLQELSSGLSESCGRGRPKVNLTLVKDSNYYISVKISVNELLLIAGDYQGDLVAQAKHPVDTYKLDEVGLVDLLQAHVTQFIQEAELPHRQIRGVGLAIQGAVDQHQGNIIWSPVFKAPLRNLLGLCSEALGYPVTIANDADCLALAIQHASSPNCKNLLAVQLGYGIGMGLILNGRLFQGNQGAVGEFGHMKLGNEGPACRCGAHGCLEAYLGDYALIRQVREHGINCCGSDENERLCVNNLVELATQGDSRVEEVFSQAGNMLGLALANVIGLFNPDKVVISGPGVNIYPLLEGALQRSLEKSLLPYLKDRVCIETHPWHDDLTGKGMITLLQQATD